MLQILSHRYPRRLQQENPTLRCNRCENHQAAYFTEIGQGKIVRMCFSCRWLPETVKITAWLETEWVGIH